MSIYSNLPKLGRVKLPSGTTYALIDQDLRLMICDLYSSSASYSVGDYVIQDDNLYVCITATPDPAGTFNSSNWQGVTVTNELKDIKSTMAGGIHFIGYTTTSLYDGATTNPILINGSSHLAVSGDLTIETPPQYALNIAYSAGEYVTFETADGALYQFIQNLSAADNVGWAAASQYAQLVESKPEFIFDGTKWNEIGSLNPHGLGRLAFKDNAIGTYVKPTGSGSVTVPTISKTSKKLSTTSITGTDGTVNASLVSGGTEKDIAKVGAAVRYGTADVGTAVTYGTANKATNATTVGNANVGAPTAVGTELGGTTTFNTDAIKAASLTGTKTFNTDAIKDASLTGTTTFTTSGITTDVDGDCLNFYTASTGTVGISTTAAGTGTVGISTTPASTASVTLVTSNITPAAASTTTIYGAVDSTSTLTPAVAAPNNQTLTPAESNGKLTGSYTIAAVTPAKVADAATTVATGGLEAGNQLIDTVTVGSTSASVTVGTTTATVTVS